MATLRTIQSPGVQIREVDLSQTATSPNGTSVFIAGFAAQGPTSEIVTLTSVSDFANIYGTPTNAAERYFYYSVQQQFTGGTNAQVQVARLPYGPALGDGFSDKYSALVYPVVPVTNSTPLSAAVQAGYTALLSNATSYYFGQPTLITLSETDYINLKQNNLFWSASAGGNYPTIAGFDSLSGTGYGLNGVGMIVVNEAQTTINEKFEGFYFNIAEINAINPSTPYKEVQALHTINANGTLDITNSPVVGFQLSATAGSNIDSVSRTIENIPTYDLTISSTVGSTSYSDIAILSLIKVKTTPFAANPLQLTYGLQEGHSVSFYSNRLIQDVNGGAPKNDFAETVINNNSANISVYINPYIANQTAWIDNNGNAVKSVRVIKTSDVTTSPSILAAGYQAADALFPLGNYAESLNLSNSSTKRIGDLPNKLNYVLNQLVNTDVYNVDVVVDAGLSTINAFAGGDGFFDDTAYTATINSDLTNLFTNDGTFSFSGNGTATGWKAVTDIFSQFAGDQRKDCVYISDPLRSIFIQGANFKTLDDKTTNFSNNIYWPLRNCYNPYNTSYTIAYGNWGAVQDVFTNKLVWVPFSGYAAATFTKNDAVAYPWGAPAGLNRGTITGLVDIALNPNQKQRDLLYKISINPVVNFPNEGLSIYGQKTMLKAPSAFDRINVRRLFLFLEKSVLNTSKLFVFEPNTTFTRSRLVNTITPVFELAKNTQGLYDYKIICNDTNNTPDTIDQNELVVDIYIKPVRTAEFILVNFYCTKTSQDFNELLQ